MQLYYDNKVAINIAHNPVQHDWTKHVETDWQFIKGKTLRRYHLHSICEDKRTIGRYVDTECLVVFFIQPYPSWGCETSMPQFEGECWRWKLPTYYDFSLFILIVILSLYLSTLVYRFLLFKPMQSYETITSNKNFFLSFRSLFSTYYCV
jgi:hypothetical protein